MRSHVALLGGVNLGARNRIAMSDLRGIAGSMGLTDVVTYITATTSDLTPQRSSAMPNGGRERRVARTRVW
ncbi:DUF1697 domain-containing protein [Gordonia sp. NPDC058843]|uniref:DUF1697 domain-containing protein n=1 Tax=Gordonia sp. NPDC058843 TaxID=3346648 RepID=UPI0036CF5DED